MQTELKELSIKRFRQFMNAKELASPADMMDDSVAALCNLDMSEIEDLDTSVYKELIKEFYNFTEDSLFNSLIYSVPKLEYNSYKVRWDEYREIFFKRSEQKYMSKLLKTDSKDISVNTKAMMNNLHILAAIIFRPEGEIAEKFNEEVVLQRAELFDVNMQVKYIYPYLKLITDKLQTKDELESSNN